MEKNKVWFNILKEKNVGEKFFSESGSELQKKKNNFFRFFRIAKIFVVRFGRVFLMMPVPVKNKAPFNFGSFYHIYNRAVDGQLLFYSQANYGRFLRNYQAYFSDVMKLYSYALIPNHFHLLASIKEEQECKFSLKELKLLNKGQWQIDDVISNRFKNFSFSHSHTIKNQFGIKTNVFAQKFKHILIDRDEYFSKLISYIHLNPVKHRIVKDFKYYPWTSYQPLLALDNVLDFGYVLDWFGGTENFIRYHQVQVLEYERRFWIDFIPLLLPD
jgi:putative transposase